MASPIADQIANFELSFGDTHDHGSLSIETIRAFERLAPQPFDRTLETGCGKSTIFFSNISKEHLVFCLDDREYSGSSVKYFQECPITKSNNIKLIFGPTQNTLPSYRFDGLLDCALIDGPHGYPFPELEYYYIYQQLRPHGYLIVDDIHIPTVATFFNFLSEDEMFELVEVVHNKTAIFRRTTAKLFDPLGDGWTKQRYNRHRLPVDSRFYLPFETPADAAPRPAQMPPNTAQNAWALAAHLDAQGRAAEALRLYIWIVEIEPDDGEAQFQLAMALDRAGQHERALFSAREASKLLPDRIAIWRLYARLAARAGRHDEAETACRNALAKDESSAALWFDLAGALIETGKFEEALRAAREALARETGNAAFHSRLADALERCGDISAARQELEKAVALEPASHWRHILLSEHLERHGALALSLSHAERAYGLRPDEPLAKRIDRLKQKLGA